MPDEPRDEGPGRAQQAQPTRPTRRTITRGLAWTVPTVVAAAAAPLAAASCASELKLLYGDFGTVTNPIVSYTGSSTKTCLTSGGVTWQQTTYTVTIKNTSTTQTISNLSVPMPYVTMASSTTGCVTPATQTTVGSWTNSTLTGFSGGPTTGRDSQIRQGTTGTFTSAAWSVYSAIIPSTISGNARNSGYTLCSTGIAPATIGVYYPPQRTLAPGASTTFQIVDWVESTSGCNDTYTFYAPDFIVGGVC